MYVCTAGSGPRYTARNGWTRERMKAAIHAGNNGKRAVGPRGCAYLTPDGNRCVVGCFIPDGHPGQRVRGAANILFYKYPDLEQLMPLPLGALLHMQLGTHDVRSAVGARDVRDVADAWIDANVADNSEGVADPGADAADATEVIP